jgi:ATP-binding cassette, subfamily B, bacterial
MYYNYWTNGLSLRSKKMTLTQLLRKNKKHLSFYMIGALLTTLSGIFSTLALSNAFGIIEETDTAGIYRRVIFVVIFAFTPIFTQLLSRFLRIGFMRDILIQVRTLAYQKIMHHSYESFKKNPKEQYMSMLVSDINLFERDFFLSLLNIIYCFGTFILGSIILSFISPIIALATIIVTSLLYIVTKLFEPIARKTKKETQEANANYNGELTNILNGLEVIKLYQVEENFKRPFESIVKVLEQVKKRSFRIDEFQSNLNHWIAGTYQMVIYVYATYLYIQESITLTALILVFNLIGQLIWSMISGFNFINRFRTSVDIYDRITATTSPIKATEKMSFNQGYQAINLSFAYDEKQVFKNLNFSIKPKEKVLIIGPSGAGKTTLLNCLAQNLSTYQGEIHVDHRDLKSIQYESFLEHCGYIRQNHFLFNDTIKNNIVLDSTFNQEKFEQVMKDVALYDWMQTLEAKENHVLEQDGINISGGQRQRLSIARELYHDRDVLFVDEPSASLDDQTSQHIYDTLLKLDKTLVCVSHRHLDYLSKHFDTTIELEPTGATT